MRSLAEVPEQEQDDMTEREVEALVDEVLCDFRGQHFDHFMSRGRMTFRDAPKRSVAEALAAAMSPMYPGSRSSGEVG